ncbi:MAG: glucose-6-phosphate isomerase [Candidatus Marinimicrobia bacterium]|nr:glucose-6-phosphate isomerase [Candidatus Neomarinimicrobiota bacterium]
MNTPTYWQKYRTNLFSNESLGLFLDISDSGVSKNQIDSMLPEFHNVFATMDELEGGSIANPDENRQVGHYWLRNPDLAPSNLIREQITQTISDINGFASNILSGSVQSPHGQPFTHVLVIGIGGSALGPQFITDALGTNDGLQIHFLDNTDPDGIDRTLANLAESISRTLIIVISKSGGTAETRNGMLETQHQFKQQKLDFAKQAVAITGEDSQLYKIATSENWLSIFPMWDWVGGRTSIMSAVGLLPLALTGVDIHTFLSGAKTMDQQTRSKELTDNPAALLALVWYIQGDGKGSKDMVILPYKDRLLLFSRYLQQLIMESLGKSLDLEGQQIQQGIAVYGNKGSTDQHAYVQQLRDGLNNFFVTFIEVLEDRAGNSILVDDNHTSGDYLFGFFKGTQTALRQNDRHSITITIADLSPKSIGGLIALYERAVGFYATLININAYHQPGVEAGKKAAGFVLETKKRILDLLSDTEQSLSIEEICVHLNLQDQTALVFSILRHHAANHPLEIEGSFFDPENIRVGLTD